VLTGPYGSLTFFTGFFLGVSLTFLIAAGDAPFLLYALAHLFCCFDDRALRRHIHSIPPYYVAILLFIYLVPCILLVISKALKSKRLTSGILVFSLRPSLAITLSLTKVPFIKALATS